MVLKYILPLLFILFISCSQPQGKIDKAWIFQKAEYPDENAQTNYTAEVINPMKLSTESFLNLQADGKYTSFLGEFDQGEWELKDQKLILKPISGWKLIPFDVQELKNGKLVLYYEPRAALYTFEGAENTFESGLDDPFSYSNNKWRMKPDRPESDAEILQRLKNHFRFYEKYFAWGHNSGQTVLNINGRASPFRFYGNGLQLVHYTNQPYEWKMLFYDTSDVKRAYLKVYDLFRRENFNWKESNDRFRMFESVFREMQKKIK
jgi:hypothetical protein